MGFNKTTATMLALGLTALLAGCEAEQTEKDMIAEAQFCLDDATDSASAEACMSKIEGLTSTKSYALRCAAGFIGAEITSPANLSSAFTSISGDSGAPAMLSALSFPDLPSAEETYDDCTKSDSSGLKLIAAMAKSATVLASINAGSCGSGSLADCNTSVIEDSLADLIAGLNASDPSAEAQVVTIVESIQTVYTTTCTGTQTTNDDICGQISSAVASSGYDITTTDSAELAAIGKELLQNWQN